MSDEQHAAKLPAFSKPPVVEVVCGIAFEPLAELKIPHYGLFWAKLKDGYPHVQHAAPIIEGSSNLEPPIVDAATGAPLPRVWFVNETDDYLIQLQLDRIYCNWRHRGNEYPHYESLIPRLFKVLTLFEEFLGEHKLGQIRQTQCELSYINHFIRGEGWSDVDDIGGLLPDFPRRRDARFLPVPVAFSSQTRYRLPDDNGTLLATVKQGKRLADEAELFILELAAKGVGPRSTDQQGLKAWFDLAHEWIVLGFEDLTSEAAQKEIWGKHDTC